MIKIDMVSRQVLGYMEPEGQLRVGVLQSDTADTQHYFSSVPIESGVFSSFVQEVEINGVSQVYTIGTSTGAVLKHPPVQWY